MRMKAIFNTLYYVFTPEDSSESVDITKKDLSPKSDNAAFQIFKTIFWINTAIWIPLFFTAIF